MQKAEKMSLRWSSADKIFNRATAAAADDNFSDLHLFNKAIGEMAMRYVSTQPQWRHMQYWPACLAASARGLFREFSRRAYMGFSCCDFVMI